MEGAPRDGQCTVRADLQFRPTEFLRIFTSLTLRSFKSSSHPLRRRLPGAWGAWHFDGKPRTARQFAVYKNCPLPTPEDRLLFLLTYLKTYPPPGGARAGIWLGQSKANQWIHVLLPALLAALRALGDAPPAR